MTIPALAVQVDVFDLPDIVKVQKTNDDVKSYANLKEYTMSNGDGTVL